MKPADSQSRLLFPAVVCLFFLSGATALVYQVAWLRSLVLVFGSTAFAVSSILTAFMAGLALGGLWAGRWIDRRDRPLAVYGILELGIGLYAVAVPAIFETIEPAFRLAGAGLGGWPLTLAAVRFLLCFGVLLVPTALMGATLPALARFVAARPRRLVASVGGLYGVNTLGAFFGAVLAGFLLLPALGLQTTLWVTAVLNGTIGAAALAMSWMEARRGARGVAREVAGAPARRGDAGAGVLAGGSGPSRRTVLIAFAATGLAALMLEVAWTRVLALVIGPSVYAFSLMLAAFLAGLGLGSVGFAPLLDRWPGRRGTPFALLSAGAGILAFGTLLLFHRLPYLYVVLFHRWEASTDSGMLFGLGIVLAALVMFPPTLLMGGLFPAALAALAPERRRTGRRVGALYAANSAGAIAGAFAAGFVAIPLLGLPGTALAAAVLYLAVAGALGWHAWTGTVARLAPLGAAALAGTVLLAAPEWDRLLMSSGAYHYARAYGQIETPEEFRRQAGSGYEIEFYEDGLVGTVLVARDTAYAGQLGDREGVPSVLLVTNGKIDASSLADMPTQVLSAHIPLLLHPSPRRAMVIGLASGTTAGSALHHPLRRLDVVEIEPAVVEASRRFDFVNGRPLDDPRTRLRVADGRTALLLSEGRYDVIISEPSNPWISGVSNLFTREFYELARSRLAEDGIFAGWVQTYGMSADNLAVLLRTFQSVFPETFVFNTIPYTDLVLVGSLEPLSIDPERLARRMARPELRADLRRAGVHGPAQLLARGRLGPDALRQRVGPGPLNTDDNALIEFAAPLDLYRDTRGENEEWLRPFAGGLASHVTGETVTDFLQRMAAAQVRLGYTEAARHTRATIGTDEVF